MGSVPSEWRSIHSRRSLPVREANDHPSGQGELFVPGDPCLGSAGRAGAFLTLKSLLAESGADVSEFAPSTPLSDPRFGKRIARVFLQLIRLAPETFPGSLTFEYPRRTLTVSLFWPGALFRWYRTVFGWFRGIHDGLRGSARTHLGLLGVWYCLRGCDRGNDPVHPIAYLARRPWNTHIR